MPKFAGVCILADHQFPVDYDSRGDPKADMNIDEIFDTPVRIQPSFGKGAGFASVGGDNLKSQTV